MKGKGTRNNGPAFVLALIGLMMIAMLATFVGLAGADGLVDNVTVDKRPVDLWFEPLSWEVFDLNGDNVVAFTGNIHPMNPEWGVDLYLDGQFYATEYGINSDQDPSVTYYALLLEGTHTVTGNLFTIQDDQYDPVPGNNTFQITYTYAAEPEPEEAEPSIISVNKEIKDKKCGKITSKINVFSVKALMTDGLFLPQGSVLMASCDGSGWRSIGSEQTEGVFVCTIQNYFPAAKIAGDHWAYFKVVSPDGRETGVWKETFTVAGTSSSGGSGTSSTVDLKGVTSSHCGKSRIDAVVDLSKDATGIAFYMRPEGSSKAILIGGPTKKVLKAGNGRIVHMDVTNVMKKNHLSKGKTVYVYCTYKGVKSGEFKATLR